MQFLYIIKRILLREPEKFQTGYLLQRNEQAKTPPVVWSGISQAGVWGRV